MSLWVLIAALFAAALVLLWWVLRSAPSEADRAMAELRASIQETERQIGEALLPVVRRTLDRMNEWLESGGRH